MKKVFLDNIMIGIEFKRNNEYNNFLNLLFDEINLYKYNFVFSEKEIHEIEDFDDVLSGEQFLDLITNNQKYYIVFFNLQIFSKNKKIVEIETYEDFKNSDCELIVLISDVEYVEIYFKDNELKDQIIKNLEKLEIKYDIKTVDNDGRYIMYVY